MSDIHIHLRFAEDLPEICLRFARELPKMCTGSAHDLPEISMIFSLDSLGICLRLGTIRYHWEPFGTIRYLWVPLGVVSSLPGG